MRRFRTGVLGATLIALGLVLSACGSGGDDQEAADGGDGGDAQAKGQITVGSDAFPEAQIVGEMYAQVLEQDGYEVERQLDLESREVRLPAMEDGQVDVAPEYLASLLSVIAPQATPSDPGDPDAVTQELQPLLEEQGLEILEYSDAVDTNAFVVTQETADEFGLSAVSDLAAVAGDMTLGAPPECPKRPYCIPGLKDVYGIEFGDYRPLEYGAATAQALKAGAVDVALLFSTDPLIEQNSFVLLDDDKDLQAADNIAPLVNAEIAGDVAGVLQPVTDALTTDGMTQLNARVAIDQEDPADVARDFLEREGILE
jgi:osmoprotectant transport system substrate-binding protein